MRTTLALLLIASTSTGCFWATTKGEGDKMRKDIAALDTRLDAKEKTLDDQIAQLQKVLDDATKLLKRNSADLGADVDKLSNDVRVANGLVTAVNNSVNDLKTALNAQNQRLDALDARIGQLETGKTTAAQTPDDLWKLGSAAYEAQRWTEAIDTFKRLVSTYPDSDRSDDALYFRGQAHGQLKEWEKAIGIYQTLLDKFPTSTYTDDGLYFAALAAQQLKACTEARSYLAIVKSKFGTKSNVSKESTALDAQLKKDAKDKNKCSA